MIGRRALLKRLLGLAPAAAALALAGPYILRRESAAASTPREIKIRLRADSTQAQAALERASEAVHAALRPAGFSAARLGDHGTVTLNGRDVSKECIGWMTGSNGWVRLIDHDQRLTHLPLVTSRHFGSVIYTSYESGRPLRP
jgi:hypothetical protein